MTNELPEEEDFTWPAGLADLSKTPAQLDLNNLEVERLSRPAEPLWATLARLGWVPPSTAEKMRTKIHELQLELKEKKNDASLDGGLSSRGGE